MKTYTAIRGAFVLLLVASLVYSPGAHSEGVMGDAASAGNQAARPKDFLVEAPLTVKCK